MGESHENKEDDMADFKFGDGIKAFFLAGVGAVAITAEKGQEYTKGYRQDLNYKTGENESAKNFIKK